MLYYSMSMSTSFKTICYGKSAKIWTSNCPVLSNAPPTLFPGPLPHPHLPPISSNILPFCHPPPPNIHPQSSSTYISPCGCTFHLAISWHPSYLQPLSFTPSISQTNSAHWIRLSLSRHYPAPPLFSSFIYPTIISLRPVNSLNKCYLTCWVPRSTLCSFRNKYFVLRYD